MIHILARFSPLLRNARGFVARFAADVRGNVLMIMGFATVPLLFATGFAVDYSHAEKLETRLDAAADAAALSSVSSSQMQQSTGTGALATQAIATFVANFDGGNGITGSLPSSSSTASSTTLTFTGAATSTSGLSGNVTVTATASTSGQFNTGRTVTVAWSGQSQNYFSGVLSSSTLPISGTSTSNADAAPYINFYMLLDNSPSMLLPSTTTGLSEIQNATKTTANPPYGCAFACHEQNPHNDGIYVYDTSGRSVFLDANYYNSGSSGYGTYYLVDTNYGNVYDSSGNLLSNYTYSGGTVYTTYSCGGGRHGGGGTCYSAVSGYWADGYWLTHNYSAIYSGYSNIDLRIDDEIVAAKALIPYAYNQATNNKVSYAMQMFAFNWTHSGSANPVTALSPLSSMTTLTSSNYSSLTVPTLGDGTHQDWWYRNSYPTSSLYLNDEGTDFTDTLSYMYNSVMATPGDGSSASSPQEVLFLITDGMADENNNGSRVHAPLDSSDLALCSQIKNKGIKIAILYTQYLPSALTGDGWSQSNVAPYLSPTDQDAAALQTCASTGSDGAPLFYSVTSDQSITAALQALFALAVQSAHLIK